ncbi:hypothetical protein L682_01460 [Aquipseudomonas alcaligenes OT 69]|nr:hypothetical protein L682_01460 [Pseudomonas alcaligenes OT 69]
MQRTAAYLMAGPMQCVIGKGAEQAGQRKPGRAEG